MMLLPSFDPNDKEGGLKVLEELTSNASEIQQQVLEDIVTSNQHTQYLSTFLKYASQSQVLDQDSTRNLFKNNVPVAGYQDMKPFIDRIANGEPSHIICAKPITELLTSSGTSAGKPKVMPSTAEDLDRKTFFYNLLVPVMNKYVEGLDQGKGMYLLFIKPEIRTPCGLMARPVLTSYHKSSHFRNRPFNPYNVYTSPDDTILCPDTKQSMYCQLLCGLLHRHEVLRVGAVFASAFLRAIRFLEDHLPQLCSDIRTASLTHWITDSACRNSVSSILNTRSSPELADQIQREANYSSCGCAGTWEGIIKKLWPRAKYIEVVVTGTMSQYIPALEFYSGGLPLVSTMYASSECYLGININPLCKPSDISYTLLPNMAYFEFLPLNHTTTTTDPAVQCCSGFKEEDRHPGNTLDLVDLVDVKIGRYYELVVTTFTGLYRYRVGDILLVTGFYNNAPQFRFVQRRNVVLSIDTDKTNEEDLLKAVTEAKVLLDPLGFLLTEYTSYADTASIPGHYVLFWELEMMRGSRGRISSTSIKNVDDDDNIVSIVAANYELHSSSSIMEQCCSTIEESLDSVYRRCRNKDKSIGPLEIRVVKPGTFDALMDFCVSQGSSVNQYKTPRCIKSDESLNILNSRVVATFFSNKTPSWEPDAC